jgi:RHS repeat-associated protein
VAPLFRKSGRARNKKPSCKSYRKVLWFRPRLELLENRILLSADNWMGGSGNWSDTSHWSLGHAPGTGDTANITTTSAATITIQNSDSIQVQNITTGSNDTLSFTGGSLTVTLGTSTLNGALSMTAGSLTANGAGVSLTADGSTSISGASLYADAGATLSLPQLTSYTTVNGSTFQADGKNSVLDLSALATVTKTSYWYYLDATNGGTLKLSSLTGLDYAGQGGVVVTDTGNSTLLDSSLASLNGVDATLDGSDANVANSWTKFTNGSLTVSGGSYSLAGLTDVDGSNLTAQGGGSLALPGLNSYAANNTTFQATGTGSVLDVSALTTVTEPNSWSINANNGGTLKLSSLTSLGRAKENTDVTVNGGTLNLSALTTYTNGSLTVEGGSALDLSTLTSFTSGNLTLDGSSSTVNLSALTTFTASNLFVQNGASLTVAALTDADASNLNARSGGSLSLPKLSSYTSVNGSTFQADGKGSVLDLSALSTVTKTSYYWYLDATNGGTLKLSSLTGLDNAGQGTVFLTDTGNSTLLDGNITTLNGVSATLDGSDAKVANSWTKFTNGSLSVTGGSYSLAGLTDVDGSNLQVQSGGSLALPGLTSYASDNTTFQATGTGSVLDVSALTTVTQTSYWDINASNGGTLKLSSMTGLGSAKESADVTVNGGTLDVSALTSFINGNLTVEGGSALDLSTLTSFTNGNLTLDGSSTVNLSALTTFTASNLFVQNGASLTVGALTDADGSSLYARTGGSLSLPKLTSYTSVNGSTFQADGKGSVLDLSALSTVTKTSYYWYLDATNGGTLKLSSLTGLDNAGQGWVFLTDTGNSTLLDGNITTLNGVQATLDGSDAKVANSWTKFTNGDLTVSGGSYSLAGLTDVDGSNLTVQSGGSLALPGLTSYAANNNTFQATGTGSVLDVSALTTVTQTSYWDINASNGGTLKLSSMTSLGSSKENADVTVNGGTLDVSALTTFTNGSLTVEGGSTLDLATLTSFTNGNLTLDGSSSTVNLSALTTFTASNLFVQNGASLTVGALTDADGSSLYARSGGSLSLPKLTSYTSVNGSTFQADGKGSVLDLSNLATITKTSYWYYLDATNGGTLKLPSLTSLDYAGQGGVVLTDTGNSTLLDSSLATLNGVQATLDGSDASVANSWTKFTNGGLTVSGGSYSLAGLTDVDGSNLTAQSGGSLALPRLTSYASNNTTFQATGTGSVLDVSALTTLTQTSSWYINADNGGTLKLSSLATLNSSKGIDVTVNGGSTLNLSALTSFTSGNLTLDGSSSTVNLSALTTFTDGNLSVQNGASLTVGTLTDADGSSLYARSGGSLSLPKLTSYTSVNGSTFQADGKSSVLDLSNLATVTKTSYWYYLDATNGGTLKLSGLTSLDYAGQGGVVVTDTGNSTLLDGNLTTLNGVDATLDGSDANVANSWTKFTNGSLTINGAAVTLPNLTEFADSTYQLNSGAALSFPVLTKGNLTLSNGQSVTIQGTVVSMPKDGASGVTINAPQSQGLTITLQNNGTFSGGTTFNVGAGTTVVLQGGTYTGGVVFNVGAGANVDLTGGYNTTYGGTLTGSGDGTVSSGSGTLTPASGGTTLNFAGNMFQWTGGTVHLNPGTFDNLGTMSFAGSNSSLIVQNPQINVGNIVVASGTLSVEENNAISISGSFDVAAGATLQFNNGYTTTLAAGTTINGAGTVEFRSGTTLFAAGSSYQNRGDVLVDGGTVDLSTGQPIQVAALTESSGTLQGSDNITVTGPTVWSGGTMTGTGTTAAQGGLQLGADDSSYHVETLNGRTLTNAGNAVWLGNGSFSQTNSSVFQNLAGGTLDFQSDMNWNSDSSATSFLNQGTLKKSAGTGSSVLYPAFTNSGSVQVQSGTLGLQSGSVSINGSGLFSSLPGTTLALSGSLLGNTTQASLFAPQGTVLLDGAGTASAPQQLEVMSQDVGPGSAGYQNNFIYNTLALSGTYVKLVDKSHNSSGTGAEALYVNSLIVPAGSTLDLNGFNVYARAYQINGTVLNGQINQTPPGGSLALDGSSQGVIDNKYTTNDWTFFGRTNQQVTVLVNPGDPNNPPVPLQPTLGYAQVQIEDGSGNIIASGTSSQSGADVSLLGVALPADGTYHIVVSAPAAQSSSIGNYTLGLFDATVNTQPLSLNQTITGKLNSGYEIDHYTFSAQANDQVQFHLVAASNSAIQFDLTGPNGYTAFSGTTTSSSLITLPSGGTYTLTVHSTGGQTGAYSFNVAQTTQTALTLGTTYQGTLQGSGQAQLFTVNVPVGGQPLLVKLADTTNTDQNELYVSFSTAPTTSTYQYRFSSLASADQQILVPSAAAGTWYILLYGNNVPAPSQYSLTATSSSVILSSITPNHYGSSQDTHMTLTGAGFNSTTQVKLIAADGKTTYAAASVQFNLPTQLTATFTANSVPAGTYSVEVVNGDGSSGTLPGAFTMIQGGQPHLVTNIIVPNPIGNHIASTLYVEYTNTGDVAMPAPLLNLTAERPNPAGSGMVQGALMTLDPSLQVSGYWTSATPQGYSSSILILASGATPGLLQPGETVKVPVYYAGWLQSQWNFNDRSIFFNLSVTDANDATPIDWTSMEAALQPDTVPSAAWSPMFSNLTAQMGNTWGSYVTALDNADSYLGSVGEDVNNIDNLWAFELALANGMGPVSQLTSATDAQVATTGSLALSISRSYETYLANRYDTGPFGLGWKLDGGWEQVLKVAADGTVAITDTDLSDRTFQPDSRGGYFAEMGDLGTLTKNDDGTFSIREQNGQVTHFLTNGHVDYVEDANGNRITAGWNTSDQLISLTASSGQSLTIAYNSAGLISSVTDPVGRATTYTYDNTNQHLISVIDYTGRTTTYSYNIGGSAATANALTEIANPDGTHQYFSYDAEGRLSDMHKDGGAQDQAFSYGSGGTVGVTDGTGDTTTYYLDKRALVVKIDDPLHRDVYFTYDNQNNLIQVTDPLGQSYKYTYNSQDNLSQIVDPLGNTQAFTYGGPDDRLTSSTDGNGNTTQYGYDANGNIISTTYPDGSVEKLAYDAQGNPTSLTSRAGQVTKYSYDSSGRLLSETFADGSKQTYSYDSRGNMVTATDSSGTTTLQYDSKDELTQITYANGQYLKYTYDSASRRTQMVDQTGFTVNYSYDSVGRLYELTDGSGNLVAKYTYDAAGRLSRKDLGNGTYTTYAYDAAGELLHEINYAPGGSVNSRFDYTYDALGDPITETTLDGTWTYTYDSIGELTHAVFASNSPATVPNQDLQYKYDAAGNRVQTIINGVTTKYTVNNLNEYTQVGGTKYAYDANGNLISQTDSTGTTTYKYTASNMLTGISGSGQTASFSYDAFGHLRSQTVNGTTTNYLVDPFGLANVVGAFTSSGAVVAHYTYGLGLTSMTSPSTGTAYYDFDANGSVVGLSSSSGTYVNSYQYLPFGETLKSSVSLQNPFQFVGKFGVMTEQSGLDFMRARFYDVGLGRFTSNDPLGLRGGSANLLTYSQNRPTSAIDPTGFCSEPLTDGEVALLIGVGLIALANAPELAAFLVANQLEIAIAGTAILNGITFPDAPTSLLETVGYYLGNDDFSDGVNGLLGGLFGSGGGGGGGGTGGSGGGAGGGGSGSGGGSGGATCCGNCGGGGGGSGGGGGGSGGSSSSAQSQDPNALYGPAGYGTSNFVADSNIVFPYRIDFENAATATAPAQRVVLTDQLDPNLDWTTFQLTGIGFGNTAIDVPANSQSYQTTVSMTYNGQTFNVNISASLNAKTGLLTVVFQSIDPNTNLPPSNVLTGFLPPEDGTGRGQGYVSYIIDPKGNLANGTQIRNVALVTFDANQSIATDQVDDKDPSKGTDPTKQALVTIDSTPPTSSVGSLPASENALNFNVGWSGSDTGGSGVASYNVYVSDNGAAYTLWQAKTTQTSATYNGVNGHTYAFYSVATDNVGNVQPTPTSAQANTTVNAIPPTSTVSALPKYGPTSFTLNWSGSAASGLSVASYSVYVSDNGGAFAPLLTKTTLTSTTFNGVNGHTYGFYSVATDNVGNVQPTPSSAQASTTVDSVPPSSSVSPLPATVNSPSFTVNWSGSDPGGPGIASYSIYVSDNGGAFTAWLTNTTQTSATYNGQVGHSYGFYSVATDTLGLTQPTPTSPQATTYVWVPPPQSPPPAPPAPPAAPTLQVPPLLAFLDSILGGIETINSDGTETITDSLFGIPLFVATFNSSGGLTSVTLFGINITFLFE